MSYRLVLMICFMFIVKCLRPELFVIFFFFLMIRRPPRSTLDRSSAASDVYKRQEELIWRQANFDSLTELPNRRMFYERLAQEIKKAHRCLLYTSPSPRDRTRSRMPSSA